MINDEKRREIAGNLRYCAEMCHSTGVLDSDVLNALDIHCGDTDGVSSAYDVEKLADLIEPEPERTCQMDKSEFADFAPEYEGLYSCTKCGEETAVLACVNEGGDMEWMKPRFCGFCGAKVVEVVDE